MTIGVFGGGAWGTALAQAMAANGGEDVLLWARESDVVADINDNHANNSFLPGISLSKSVRATSDIGALATADVWLVVCPAQHVRSVLSAAPHGHRPSLILCAKGIEAGSLKLMAEVAAEIVDAPLAVLSGPSFAHEVARGLPTAITLACADARLGRQLVQRLVRDRLRLYLTDDVVGAEIGGAVKNVLAIGCGVVEGAGLGLNARAALIARGFAEMVRFGVARGARAETLGGLSGLGDLVLTCNSTNSRNFTLGVGLGQGLTAGHLLAASASVAEGATTAPVLVEAARAAGVEMPISAAVANLLAGKPLAATVEALLSRPLRDE